MANKVYVRFERLLGDINTLDPRCNADFPVSNLAGRSKKKLTDPERVNEPTRYLSARIIARAISMKSQMLCKRMGVVDMTRQTEIEQLLS